ncbi:integrase domain-containing protein [Caballeronia pedi]|nr:integrase domain-containing protein [Caballeronia pedi]
MSNAAVGIAGASRSGTKRRLSPEEAQQYIARAEAIDAGVAMVLRLQMEFGRRAQEAVRCVPSLPDWSRVLTNAAGNGMVTIVHGTKGGKTRRSPALDGNDAVELVHSALDLACRSNGRLVRKPDLKKSDGAIPLCGAEGRLGRRDCTSQPRYAYACEHLRRLKGSASVDAKPLRACLSGSVTATGEEHRSRRCTASRLWMRGIMHKHLNTLPLVGHSRWSRIARFVGVSRET